MLSKMDRKAISYDVRKRNLVSGQPHAWLRRIQADYFNHAALRMQGGRAGHAAEIGRLVAAYGRSRRAALAEIGFKLP